MTQSKTLCFQLHLDRGEEPTGLRAETIRTLIASAGGRISDEELGNDDGQYLNFFIPADRPSNFLCVINDKIDLRPDIMRSLIIICEGSNGWDNYLLIRHFDEDEQSDPPPDDI